MISEFLSWWGRQLAALLPQAMHMRGLDIGRAPLVTLLSPIGVAPQVVEIVPSPGSASEPPRRFVLDEDAAPRLRAAFGRGAPAALRLRLPAGSLLERDVVLPLAAERGLGRVLQYEMDRLTPFTASEALWSCVVQRRDRGHGRLHLRLTLASRAAVEPVIDRLRQAGFAPTMLEAPAATAAEAIRRIDLTPRRGETGRRRPGLRAGLALCGVLAFVLVALPFARQSLSFSQLDHRLAALRLPVAEAGALRRRIATQSAGSGVFAAERLEVGDPLRTLAAVTEALPDDTWLTDFTLQQRQLRINGESKAAVQLIGRLAADRAIANPTFTAPVTSDDSRHADLFAIAAEVTP
jgi:general secretion pathway protein L